MIRVDLSYIHEYSKIFNYIKELKNDADQISIISTIRFIKLATEELIESSIYSTYLSTCIKSASSFIVILNKFIEEMECKISQEYIDDLKWEAHEFEITLKSALANTPTYVVSPKGGYDVNILTMKAELAFPPYLTDIVPETKYDVDQVGKCLAFEVPTAAAFHLHRINEAVLHRYWSVISGEDPLEIGSIGNYLKKMKSKEMENKNWSNNILFVLEQINKLHRNPVLHPEQNLIPQEAIELFGIINSSISAMLSSIILFTSSVD